MDETSMFCKDKLLVGSNLRKLRESMGLSLSQLASMSGISYRSISEYENGEGNPSLEKLLTLCKCLGANFSELFETQDVIEDISDEAWIRSIVSWFTKLTYQQRGAVLRIVSLIESLIVNEIR